MVLKIDYDKEKLQKVTYDAIIDVIQITSQKVSYQNNVTNFFLLSSPSLSNILVALLSRTKLVCYCGNETNICFR